MDNSHQRNGKYELLDDIYEHINAHQNSVPCRANVYCCQKSGGIILWSVCMI